MKNYSRMSSEEFHNKSLKNSCSLEYVKIVVDTFLNTPIRGISRPPLNKLEGFTELYVEQFRAFREKADGNNRVSKKIKDTSPYKILFGERCILSDIDMAACLSIIGETPAKKKSKSRIIKPKIRNVKRNHYCDNKKCVHVNKESHMDHTYDVYDNIYYENTLPFLNLNIYDYFRYLGLLNQNFFLIYEELFSEMDHMFQTFNGDPATISDVLNHYDGILLPDDELEEPYADVTISFLARSYDRNLKKLFTDISDDKEINPYVFYFFIQTVLIVGLYYASKYTDHTLSQILRNSSNDTENIDLSFNGLITTDDWIRLEQEALRRELKEHVQSLTYEEYLVENDIDPVSGQPRWFKPRED